MHRSFFALSDNVSFTTSAFAESEAIRNIIAKRPAWETGYHQIMNQVAIVPEGRVTIPLELAEKDKPILAAAINDQSDFLVTGDKRDFGHLYHHTIEGVTVIDYLHLMKKVFT